MHQGPPCRGDYHHGRCTQIVADLLLKSITISSAKVNPAIMKGRLQKPIEPSQSNGRLDIRVMSAVFTMSAMSPVYLRTGKTAAAQRTDAEGHGTKASGSQLRGPIKRCPTALSSAATNLLGYCFGEDRLAVRRLRIPVGKAQNLKTAGIADDPKIQLAPFPVSARNFDKARQTSLLFDGSIDAR